MSNNASFSDVSPIGINQKDLIRLSASARVIPLEVLYVKSLQSGSHLSNFKGRGMEFDESRPYQPGDDPRSIDWRVTARSTEAYTKLFREERERPVFVMTDLRSNMHFATQGRYKSVNASYAAALVAWAAHHRGDRLGGIIYGDTINFEIRARLGRQAALRYLHKLVIHPDWKKTNGSNNDDTVDSFTNALSAMRRVARPGSLVVIVSDFQGFSRLNQSYLATISRHNEVLALFVSDPLEIKLPPPGRYRLVNEKHELDIDTYSLSARKDYEHEFQSRYDMMIKFCQRYNIYFMPLSTTDDPVALLQKNLGKRRH